MDNRCTCEIQSINTHTFNLKFSALLLMMILVLSSHVTVFALINSGEADKYKENSLELIGIEAENPTNKGFKLNFIIKGEASTKDASIVYAYTIFDNLIVRNYNIGFSAILPTTKTVNLENLTRNYYDNGVSVYSVDINEVMPQTFYIYAMLNTPNEESELKSCVLNTDKEAIYRVISPGYSGITY